MYIVPSNPDNYLKFSNVVYLRKYFSDSTIPMAFTGEIAYVLDVDDVMFNRGGVTRLGGYLFGMLTRDIHHDKLRIRELDRTVSRRPVRGPERTLLNIHARRWMYQGVPRLIGTIHHKKEAVYVNTGRPNVAAWVEMTKDRLSYYGIGHLFTGMFFRPEGVSTAESKAEALHTLSRMYEQVRFADDDGRTILRLAPVMPKNVELNLLHQPLTHRLVPEALLASFANIRQIDHISQIRR